MLVYIYAMRFNFVSFCNHEELNMTRFRIYIYLISYIYEAMISKVRIIIYLYVILGELFHNFEEEVIKLKHFLLMP